MKAAFVLALCASLASAWVVITPITKEMVVDRSPDDCFFGVVTPQGCGYVSQVHLGDSFFDDVFLFD